MNHREAPTALELPSELLERAAEAGAEPLVREAFEAGAEKLADALLGYITGRLTEAERLYGEPMAPGRAAVLERPYQAGAHPAVLEAHFSAVGAVLYELRAELRRIHSPGLSAGTGD